MSLKIGIRRPDILEINNASAKLSLSYFQDERSFAVFKHCQPSVIISS